MTADAGDGWVDSPFRAKGVLYLGTQSFFKAHSPIGIETVAAQLQSERLRDFIRQKFLAGGQYEVMVVPALIEAEAKALGQTLERYLLYRTRWQAERDTGGVYKLLLKLTSPETVMSRLPKLLTQMFNFGVAAAVTNGGGNVELTVTGIPAPLVPWLQVAFKVYCETAIGLAGGKSVLWTSGTPTVESPKDGFPMRAIHSSVTWT